MPFIQVIDHAFNDDARVTQRIVIHTVEGDDGPVTISGLKWSLQPYQDPSPVADIPFADFNFAFVILKEDELGNDLEIDNGEPFFRPADQVWTFGQFGMTFLSAAGNDSVITRDSSRGTAGGSWNLQEGDTLVLLIYTNASDDNNIAMRGLVGYSTILS